MTSLSTSQATAEPATGTADADRPVEDRAARIERLREAAYRIRLNALTMGEVQGQGYIGQALGVADVLAVAYTDQLRLPTRRTRTGRTATGSCSRSATTPSRCTRRWPRPGSSRSRSWRPTAPTSPGCRCRAWRPTRRAWRSPAARWATAWRSPPGWRSGCATRATRPGCTTCCPTASSTRARRGRRRCRPPTTTWTTSPRSSTSTPCRPTAPPKASCAPSRSPTSGRRSAGTRCGSTATTSKRSSTPSTSCARTAARPAVLICDTRIGCGVPLLETREKAHFMRVSPSTSGRSPATSSPQDRDTKGQNR